MTGRLKVAIRPLRIVSFECDLDPLRLVMKNPGRFPHVRHGAPHELLKAGRWQHRSGLLEWELRAGDFLTMYPDAALPDVVFYDPFSYKTDSALWTAATFAGIFGYGRSKSVELYTYSAATAVRVALLTAGFFVAEGVGTGPKADTTVAFSREPGAMNHPLRPRLLGAEWLARWRRSGSKWPGDLPVENRAACERAVETHPQFAAAVAGR